MTLQQSLQHSDSWIFIVAVDIDPLSQSFKRYSNAENQLMKQKKSYYVKIVIYIQTLNIIYGHNFQ